MFAFANKTLYSLKTLKRSLFVLFFLNIIKHVNLIKNNLSSNDK